ncbi:hypothetical protein ACFRFH_00465 [Leifsonia sp. NPDC056824]|uniref:hypothetical protein n=1 Tax=Leifsonia sp. NPDC056824 TaxID=3345953 RepID=UPI00369611E2
MAEIKAPCKEPGCLAEVEIDSTQESVMVVARRPIAIPSRWSVYLECANGHLHRYAVSGEELS